MSVSAFAFSALIVLIGSCLIWLVTKFEGGTTSKYVSDFAFVTSSLGSLFFLPYADAIDAGFLSAYAAAIFIFRFWKLRKALNIQQISIHLVITYLTVSRLNKVTGYGGYDDWLDIADYACFFLLLIFIWSLYFQKQKWAYMASFLLFVPLTQVPLEIVRNIFARQLTGAVNNAYVTKIETSCIANWLLDRPLANATTEFICIYGIESNRLMKLITVDRKERLNPMTGLLDGGGTIGAQGINIWVWEYKLYQYLFQYSSSKSQ